MPKPSPKHGWHAVSEDLFGCLGNSEDWGFLRPGRNDGDRPMGFYCVFSENGASNPGLISVHEEGPFLSGMESQSLHARPAAPRPAKANLAKVT